MNNTVFQYWHSGVDSMPNLVKQVYEHNKKISERYNFKLIVVDLNTVKNYITVPDYFEKLTPNHQSDIFRFCVLDKYGGLWLDSDGIILKDLNTLFSEFIHSQYDAYIYCEGLILPSHLHKLQIRIRLAYALLNWFPNLSPKFRRSEQAISCSTMFIKKQSAFSQLAYDNINQLIYKYERILEETGKLPYIPWTVFGPNVIKKCYYTSKNRVRYHHLGEVINGMNFISWYENPGYYKKNWLLSSQNKAAEKAKKIYINTSIVNLWTIYRIHRPGEDMAFQVLHNKHSVFHNLIKISRREAELD